MNARPVELLLKEKKIYEIVNPRLVQAGPHISVEDAVNLMRERRSGYIVIAEEKKVVGLFTEADVVQKILEKEPDWSKPVREFMLREPPILSMNDSVGRAIDLMGRQRLYHIPLVD